MARKAVRLMAIMVFSIISMTLRAQSVNITGVIVDSNGQPVPGVSVFEDGTTNGTATDLDGAYSFSVSKNSANVVVSCIGYITQTFKASELASLSKITLQEDTEMMDEVVVIGYGGVKKEDLTGSVSVVSVDEINRGPISDTYQLLRGKSAGVQIIPGNGAPGTPSTIRIRGAASLNASNDPLIVVDGVTLAQNDMSMINPDDIKSFTILKDASATAIYGSRASNGVVLITTKKGSTGGVNITFNGTYNIVQAARALEMLDASQFTYLIRSRYPDRANAVIGKYDTNWQDEVLRLGFSTTNTVGVSGNIKGGKMPWRVSVGQMHQDGTLIGSYTNRGTLSANVSPSLLEDHLEVNLSLNANISNGRSSNVYSTASFFNPTMPVHWYNEDGSIDYTTTNGWFNYGSGRGDSFAANDQVVYQSSQNPVGSVTDSWRKGNTLKTVASAKVEYKVHGFEDLKLTASLAYEGNNSKIKSGNVAGSFANVTDNNAPGVGTYSIPDRSGSNTLFEAFANYNHDFSGHRVDVMGGYTWNRVFNHSYSETRFNDDYTDPKGEHFLKDSIYGNPTTNDQEYVLMSFYGRLNYSYKGRYLVTFTLRDDASSRFSPETRWGLFPSVALAWNLAEERFIKNMGIFSQFKLRTGWGVTGQQDIGSNYPYIPRYTITTSVSDLYDMGSAGFLFRLKPNAYDPNIKWEETTTMNVGVDFGFLKDRITASFDFYKRNTKDLLNNVTVPIGSNFSNTLLTNIGSIENKGFEMAFSFIPVSTRDWNVEIGLNGTLQDTKFTQLTNTNDPNYGVQVGQIAASKEGFLELHRVGYAPYTFYCYKQLYDETGKPIQNASVDLDGDGFITNNDRYMTGKSAAPKFFGGVSYKMSYKNWDFGFNGHYSIGNYMFNDIYGSNSTSATDFGYNFIHNYSTYVLKNEWLVANQPNQNFSDMFLENASFFRMDDINVGYSFTSKKSDINYRFALSVENAFVLTKYTGMDPESFDSKGIDTTTLGSSMSNTIFWPRPRTYSLRLTVKF